MTRSRKAFCLASLFFMIPALICTSTVFATQEFKIGVLANRGAAEAAKEWQPTAEYLSAKLGKTFTVVPLDFQQLPQWAKEKKIDFIITNSAMYAELNKLYSVQAIATRITQYKNQPLEQFGSVVIVPKDSPINHLADFRNKDFMCVDRASFGGWLMTQQLFIENGIDPNRDLRSVRETQTHDHVVYAVMNGVVDGGTVRTSNLEKMAEEGKIKMGDFKIIHQISDGYPLVHSTRLYPEWPIAVTASVPANVKAEVAQALMSMEAGEPAAKKAKIVGWRKPMDYGPVVDCLTKVQFGAFAVKK